MELTKREHACLEIRNEGATLIIDPGAYTPLLPELAGVVGVVVTHEHADHWTADQLTRILTHNPEARIFAPQGVADAAAGFDIEVVGAGTVIELGAFQLRFFGGTHAIAHPRLPNVDNVGVLVNGAFYFAGDSLVVPEDVQVDTLAVTAGAPWMKISEAMDYIEQVRPRQTFGTHELVLSPAGIRLANLRLKDATDWVGGVFHPLEPGDTITI